MSSSTLCGDLKCDQEFLTKTPNGWIRLLSLGYSSEEVCAQKTASRTPQNNNTQALRFGHPQRAVDRAGRAVVECRVRVMVPALVLVDDQFGQEPLGVRRHSATNHKPCGKRAREREIGRENER